MYSFEYDPDEMKYTILDPDGDLICQVVSRGEAEAIISHLNR